MKDVAENWDRELCNSPSTISYPKNLKLDEQKSNLKSLIKAALQEGERRAAATTIQRVLLFRKNILC